MSGFNLCVYKAVIHLYRPERVPGACWTLGEALEGVLSKLSVLTVVNMQNDCCSVSYVCPGSVLSFGEDE